MFSGWVGDQDSSYDGFKVAMKNMFHSAWQGYLNFGFDLGGYRGQNISKTNFIREAQLAAMVPLMENGGNGKHCPWLFDNETVDLYRKAVLIHQEMKPFFLTAGTEAYSKKVSVMKPNAKKQGKWAPHDPSDWGYTLWNDFLVYPVLNDAGIVTIRFSQKADWIYYFNHSKTYRGGTSIEVMIPLD